jgi:uncharacterized membrane protein/Mg-chelatase subunit ChlD
MKLAAWSDLLRFETPGYLVLLAVIPLLVALSFRSLAGLGPARRAAAIIARTLVVVCMVLALAGAQSVRRTHDLSVVFVVDRSHSVPRNLQEDSFGFIQDASTALRREHDRIGVVAFNGVSAVEQLPASALGIDRLSDPAVPDQTNIAAALRMAAALFTDDAARRIVVLSDGNQTAGQALEEADQLRAAGVLVDVLPLRYEHADEVVFERLSAPATATSEETINLQMVLRATRPAAGRILLYHNEQLIDLDPRSASAGYPVTLDAGPNRLQIPVPLRAAGAHRFRAVFEPGDPGQDAIAGNNEGRAFTIVSGQGRILILTTVNDHASAQILARALAAEKLECDVEIAGEQPIDQVRLLEYSAVILSNVARNYLSEEAEKSLTVYVRDLGGGLIMVGGDESYGAGGWLGSPVEEIMPVSFDVKAKKQIPKGALVLVMHACEIPQGNYWGERVAVESVKTLSSRDLIGILQYEWRGAQDQYWLVPLREVGDKAAIIRTIRSMNMGDLPDLDAVMRPGVEALISRTDAAARHMIVISDFDPARPRDDLIQLMQTHKITCSTVAIGFGGHTINVGLAQLIARSTGGKYYEASDPTRLPQIFIKESQVVRRSLIHEVRFTPRIVSSLSPVIAGLEAAGLPPLDGYVLTTARPLAQVALVRETEEGQDPILAHWQVGLGKSVAFTSGMWPRWGADWAPWAGFSKLWAQVVRWASRQSAAAALDVSTSVEGGIGRIRVEARDKNAAAINFMTIEGTLVDPELKARPLLLVQTGPGEYEGQFGADQAGSYVFNLAYQMGSGADAVSGTLQTGASVAFSPEFRNLRTNERLLSELAGRTGGRVLARQEAAAVFDRTSLPTAEVRRSIWEDLTRLMLLLFLLDVAIRRIAVHPLELLRKLRQRIAELGAARRPAEESVATLATLKGTREVLRETLTEAARAGEAGTPPSRPARYEPPVPDSRVTEELSKALGGASEKEAPIVARPTRKAPKEGEADYTSRLLKAKRRARDDMDTEKR